MKKIVLSTLFAFSTVFANESTYTSIAEKDCKTIKVYEHNMSGSVNCEPFERFGVDVNDEDARMDITITHHGIEYPQLYASAVSPLFSTLGQKIEWRYAKGESYAPYAFITRFNESIENEHAPSGHKERSNLVVSKIDKHAVCVVGVIPPQKNQNLLARALADKAKTMPCLLEEQNHREAALKKVLATHAKLESIIQSEKAFTYMRDMGPLEHTLRVLKTPSFPVWRMRLRLYPIFSDKFPSQLGGYKVVTDMINLSYALHDTLIEQYGVKNVDSTLKNSEPSRTYSLGYMIMRTPATFLEESVDLQYNNIYLEGDTCGLQKSCIQPYEEVKGDWGKETPMNLTKAPWEQHIKPLPSMLRVLAKKAGWVKKNGPLIEKWQPMEMPEGMHNTTPWVEVIIENHADNGGGYLMTWSDLVSDDSIEKTLYHVYYDEASQSSNALVQSAVLCARGKNTTNPTQMCQ